MIDQELHEAAVKTVRDCMGVTPDELVTIVVDTEIPDVGEVLVEAVKACRATPIFTRIQALQFNGEEPPAPIAELMKSSPFVMLCTSRSLSHTRATKNATKAGARVASMPGITLDMLRRTMNVNWHEVASHSRNLCNILKGSKYLRLTTDAGTDLTINIEGLNFGADTGLFEEPGVMGNLPGGEICLGPHYEGSDGVVIFDGSFAGLGMITTPFKVEFRSGEAISFSDNPDGKRMVEMLSTFGQKGRMLAEIGIGTHPTAKVTGKILEDEKVLGTVHLALGNNLGFGGSNDVAIHIDGIILRPTLVTDTGLVILDNGEMKL